VDRKENNPMQQLSREEALKLIQERYWYHNYELLPGVWTGGQLNIHPQQYLDRFKISHNLTGKRVLDIGTWDGPIAFELEKRGAAVTALDIQDPDKTGFNTAKRILNSHVSYVRGSVYDASKLLNAQFDFIMYLGVFYHLKHPILGFEEIARILSPQGIVYIEGELLVNYAETLDNHAVSGDFAEQLGQSDVPLTLCYPGMYKGTSNWFVPNLACFKGWLQASGLEIVDYPVCHNG
jgi:tRNA (mo5U34)-methyltransferase